MDTLTAILIITALILVAFLIFLISYFKNEKVNREIEYDNIESLKTILSELQTFCTAMKTDMTDSFNELRKEVKISQDKANTKMNSGFITLEEENKEIRKEASAFVNKLQTTFKDYAERVDKLLVKYTNDNIDNQKETNQIKQQIQQELQNILKEIKSPLDLD